MDFIITLSIFSIVMNDKITNVQEVSQKWEDILQKCLLIQQTFMLTCKVPTNLTSFYSTLFCFIKLNKQQVGFPFSLMTQMLSLASPNVHPEDLNQDSERPHIKWRQMLSK